MSYSSEVLADAPGGYWRMSESSGLIQDASGNGNHATSTNGSGSATYQEPGAILSDPGSKSIKFSNFGFNVPDHATLDFGDVFTLECWLKRDNLSGLQHMFAKFLTFNLRIETDDTFGLVRDAIANIVFSTTTITDTTTWHHCVATKNGATAKLYHNGADVTGTVTNSTVTNTAEMLRIGTYDDTDRAFLGWLDEIALYPTALTQARVQAHHSAASAQVPPFANVTIL